MATGDERCFVAWTKSLQSLAKVSSIANHLKGCGKKEIGEKGYKFFTENYTDDVFVKEEDGRVGTCEVKAVSVKRRLQTADCRPGVKCRLRVK